MCKYYEIRPLAKDETSFEDFLFLSSGGHLVQWSGTIAAILKWIADRHNFSSFRSRSHPVACNRASFGSRRPKVWEEMSKIDFQDGSYGGHLGCSISSFS